MATNFVETLDGFIATIGDKFDKVNFDEAEGFGGAEFANRLVREGYKTRRAWRKSNRKQSEGKAVAGKSASAFVDLKAKATKQGNKAMLAAIEEVERSHGLK